MSLSILGSIHHQFYPSLIAPVHYGWVWIAHLAFAFFLFFFFLHAFVSLRLLFMYCSMNSSRKLWLFYFFQLISAHHALFMDSRISLFNNFFIKNWSHDTIYTFKNHFATVFFSFQFSAVSKWILRLTKIK